MYSTFSTISYQDCDTIYVDNDDKLWTFSLNVNYPTILSHSRNTRDNNQSVCREPERETKVKLRYPPKLRKWKWKWFGFLQSDKVKIKGLFKQNMFLRFKAPDEVQLKRKKKKKARDAFFKSWTTFKISGEFFLEHCGLVSQTVSSFYKHNGKKKKHHWCASWWMNWKIHFMWISPDILQNMSNIKSVHYIFLFIFFVNKLYS